MKTEAYRVAPGEKVRLADFNPADDDGWDKDEAERAFAKLCHELADLQELLYAEGKHALLIVLQAMDAAGKDTTIRDVCGAFNPQGCAVYSFKAPSELERRHDFLWRVHAQVPGLGYVGVWNRSHYEDVLVARVKKLVPHDTWKARYDHINAFETLLTDEGVTIVKLFLHISKDYQKKRLQRRLDKPEKNWKFNPADLVERERWDEYREAFEDVFDRCSTHAAPWYVIPAEQRWFRNLLVAQIIADAMRAMKMSYPKPTFDPREIVIP